MSKRKFDITSGGFINTNGNFGYDDDGNTLFKIGSISYMDDDGEIHFTSGFNDDDDD